MSFARPGFWRAIPAALALLFALPVFAAPPRLQYVVIISRHGVRSPTWAAARLNQYSTAPWPAWKVRPGYLTPHGRALILSLGGYYRDWLLHERLFRARGCQAASKIYIRADRDERTLETGRAFAESLLPGCHLAVHSRPVTERDPLFSGVGRSDPGQGLRAVRQRLAADSPRLLEELRAAVEELQFILTGGKSAPSELPSWPAEIEASIRGRSIALNGPFAVGSTLSEDLLLEYTDGMSEPDLGWGRLTAKNLYTVLQLHSFHEDLTHRTKYLAQAKGSNLLAHVLRAMEQAESGKPIPGALGHPGDGLLLLAGHDSNIASVSGMLGLSWRLQNYPPGETPPGGALVFSLWRDGHSGRYYVRSQFLAQTLRQMHDAPMLSLASPPAEESLSVPGCGAKSLTAGCPWQKFKAIAERAIDPAFVSFPSGGAAPAFRQRKR